MGILPKSIVTVFVRHNTSCSHSRRGEFYRGCDCPKFLRYSRNGKQTRKAAKTRSWSVAEERAIEEQEALDRGEQPKPILIAVPQPTIADCIDTFISKKESKGISARRIKKFRFQLADFEKWMAARGKLFPASLTSTDLIDYRATWSGKWKVTTRQKAQQNIRGFLRTCCNENLNELLAALDKLVKTREDEERLAPKPFTEKEIKVLFAQIPKTFFGKPERAALATLLIKTMVATGLAIRDATQLRRKDVADGWLRIRRQKTGRRVVQHLDSALVKELLDGDGEYIFWDGKIEVTAAVTDWQDEIRLLMQEAKLWIPGNTTHRFRDTAVDFWLGAGWSMTEIAAALGDTVAVCEKHYADLASKRVEERLVKLPKRSWEQAARA